MAVNSFSKLWAQLLSRRRNAILLIQVVIFIPFIWYIILHYPKKQSLETRVMNKHRQCMENSRVHFSLKRDGGWEKPFKILFWTQWYNNVVSDDEKIFKYRDECGSEFILTSNRSKLGSADAIVFSLMDLPWNRRNVTYQFPQPRNPNVPWILAVTEASSYYPALRENFNGIFNWTWSPQMDSEIHVSFIDLFEKLDTPNEGWLHGSEIADQFLRSKTKVAAWVASNCQLLISKRQQLVNELIKRGVQIDIYGGCGKINCERGVDCFKKLGKQYKFYMSFENSLCVGYSTEKIYNGLYHGMVPIVYGLGNYSNKAPEGSWIDAMDYKTVDDLANHIKYLSNDTKAYMEYFKWRVNYEVKGSYDSKNHCAVWRQIRERMYLVTQGEERFRHVYNHLKVWYHLFHNPTSGTACRRCVQRVESVHYLQQIREGVYNNKSNCM